MESDFSSLYKHVPLTLFLIAFACFSCLRADNKGSSPTLRVAVSIRPLHSLTAFLMQGRGMPTLLFHGRGCPHHAPLTPQDLLLMKAQNLIIWVGKDLETSWADLLEKPVMQNKQVRISDEGEPTRYNLRTSASANSIDPHMWLDPINAFLIAKRIYKALVTLDPAGSNIYTKNLKNLRIRLQRLHQKLKNRFAQARSRPYLIFHDNIQYFQRRYRLPDPHAILDAPMYRGGSQALLNLMFSIRTEKISILLYTPSETHHPYRRLFAQDFTHIPIDMMGADISPGPELYFVLMDRLGEVLYRTLVEPLAKSPRARLNPNAALGLKAI